MFWQEPKEISDACVNLAGGFSGTVMMIVSLVSVRLSDLKGVWIHIYLWSKTKNVYGDKGQAIQVGLILRFAPMLGGPCEYGRSTHGTSGVGNCWELGNLKVQSVPAGMTLLKGGGWKQKNL